MIMASCHTGQCAMYEARCQCDPQMKNMWGCDKPSQHVVWVGMDETCFYSCPIKFITSNSIEWFSEQSYYKEYGNVYKYHELPSVYVEAMEVYNSYLYDYKMKEIEEKSRKNDKANIAPLMSTVKNRRK